MASVENYIPYQPNAQGLTEVLLDLKSTMPSQVVAKVTGYVTNCFEDVTQGDAVYSRASDGFIGKAIANDTEQKAQVAGFAETTQSAGQEVRALVRGVIATSGLNAGNLYFLSNSSAGGIIETPPTTAGHFVVPVGEAGTSAQFIIKVEPEILLS